MITTNADVSLMVMYQDESVCVRYGDGSTLSVSPCGSEFVMVKVPPGASVHPLHTTEPIRQRTRFAISSYKELMQGALVFRNKYASRPYLPYELIPAVDKKPFFSIDSEAEWPHISSCDAVYGPRGDVTVMSVEGRATLTLSSSGEDFLVDFLCSLRQPDAMHNTQRMDPPAYPRIQQTDQTLKGGPSCHIEQRVSLQRISDHVDEPKERAKTEMSRQRSCSPQSSGNILSQAKETHQCTTVVAQHHSCYHFAPMWQYPLSVAQHYWATRRRATPRACTEGEGCVLMNENRQCPVPEPLPLRCPSPHLHRWKEKYPLAHGGDCPDQDIPWELTKVMWCQGVIYRILCGSISVIEVSPGDGSVIRSNDVLSSYFTHYKDDSRSGQVKEVSYHVNSLPPDVPGQVYSIRSIVGRASRILTSYHQAKASLMLHAMPSCLEQESSYSKPVTFEDSLLTSVSLDPHLNLTQMEHSRSDIVSAELEKIKRFNFLLENSNVPRVRDEGSARLYEGSGTAETFSEPIDETYIAKALERTSKAIQDIDAVISAATLT